MTDKNLRSSLIRLAYENPKIRGAVLTLLKTSSEDDGAIKIGDLVKLNTRKGWVEGTIVSVRPMRTGNLEIHATSTIGDLKFTSKGWSYANNAKVMELIGRKGYEGAKEELEEFLKRDTERADRRENFAEKGRKSLDELNLQPGDTILIAYSNGPKIEETVVKVNYSTGKVGVIKATRMSPEERRRLKDVFEYMNDQTGTHVRPPLEREVRWIPGSQIVSVVERAK